MATAHVEVRTYVRTPNMLITQEAQRHEAAPLPGPALRLVAWQLLLALAHCHEHQVSSRGAHGRLQVTGAHGPA